jgi:hypothetical protein
MHANRRRLEHTQLPKYSQTANEKWHLKRYFQARLVVRKSHSRKKESRRLRARGTGSKSLALQNIKNAA